LEDRVLSSTVKSPRRAPACGPAVNWQVLDSLREFVDKMLGLSVAASDLHFSHMALRAFVVFSFGVMLARLADRRMLGHNAGFDIMLLVVLGSVLSRAVNGQAAFFPTLGASVVLVALHHVLGSLAFRYPMISKFVKGRPDVLVHDGKIDEAALRRNNITPDDLDENLRLNGNENGTGDIAEARLERNGSISVVKAKGPPKQSAT
jgi:uncharacterized membrane protein YcaP (DUF421 family)